MNTRRSVPQRMLIAANLAGVLMDAEHFIRDCEPINELEALAETQSRLTAWIADATREAREAGHSWATIGTALGITKQGAQQRYGPKKEWTAADTMAGQVPIPELADRHHGQRHPVTDPVTIVFGTLG